MRCLNRCLTLFLCIIMVLSVPNTVFTINSIIDSEDVQVYSVPIISNEYKGSYVTFYEVGGKYYLSFDDIKELARFELEETNTTLTLTQGLRELVIEKSSVHLVDCDLVDQGNIDIKQYDGKYLCEGIPKKSGLSEFGVNNTAFLFYNKNTALLAASPRTFEFLLKRKFDLLCKSSRLRLRRRFML